MANGNKQPKTLVRKVATHKVTSGAAGKKKAAAERLKRQDALRQAATQAIYDKKEGAQRRAVAESCNQLATASNAMRIVAAATMQTTP